MHVYSYSGINTEYSVERREIPNNLVGRGNVGMIIGLLLSPTIIILFIALV